MTAIWGSTVDQTPKFTAAPVEGEYESPPRGRQMGQRDGQILTCNVCLSHVGNDYDPDDADDDDAATGVRNCLEAGEGTNKLTSQPE